MKKLKIIGWIILIIINLLLVFSCKKEEKVVTQPPVPDYGTIDIHAYVKCTTTFEKADSAMVTLSDMNGLYTEHQLNHVSKLKVNKPPGKYRMHMFKFVQTQNCNRYFSLVDTIMVIKDSTFKKQYVLQ